MNETIKKKMKVGLCKIFWYLFIIQSLFIIYNIAPKPADPIIMISEDFAKITGPSIVQEGNTTKSYKIEVNKNISQDLTITLRYDGVAQNGVDFVGPKNVVIKEDELSTLFTIKTFDDALKEGSEDFSVKIQTINGPTFMQEYNTTDATGVVYTKIVDEANPKHADSDTLSILITGSKEIFENNKESIYTITLSQKAVEDIDLDLAFDGKAVINKDFTAPTHIVIPKGKAATSFSIKTIDNLFKNAKKSLHVKIVGLDDICFEDIRYESAVYDVTIKDEVKPSKDMLLTLSADTKRAEDRAIKYKITSFDTLEDDLTLVFKIIANDKNSYDKNLSVVMKKGTKEVSFSLPLHDDNIKENKQSIRLELIELDKGKYESVVLKNPSVKTELFDEKPVVDSQSAKISFELSTSNVYEDAGVLDVVVSISQRVQEDLKVYLKYEGTAKFARDYKADRRVVIKKGEKEAKLKITLLDDNKKESNETIIISNHKLKGGGLESVIKANAVTITLKDEVKPVRPDLQSASYKVSGATSISENSKRHTYKVKLSTKALKDIEFKINYSGTAQKDVDFKVVDSFVIKKGESFSTFTLKILNDKIKEGSENILLDIVPINQESFEDLRGVNIPFEINLLDEVKVSYKRQDSVTLNLSTQKRVKEGDSLVYTLRLSEPALKDMEVSVLLELKDKTKSTQVKKLLIKKGDSVVTFTQDIANDNVLESSSYLSAKVIKYSDGGYENISSIKKKIQTKIEDDKNSDKANQAILKLLTKDNIVIEDEETKEIELSLSQMLEKDLLVELEYFGVAQNGVDFRGSKSILMKKGTQSKVFNLKIFNDNFLEGEETLGIKIKKISGGGLENIDTSATLALVLKDEDKSKDIALVSLKGPTKVSEGKKTKAYTLNLSQRAQEDLLVSFSYDNSTASDVSDYKPLTQVTIKEGQKQKRFFIKTLNDDEIEDLKSIHITVSTIQGGGLEGISIDPKYTGVTTKITDEVDIANAFKNMVSKQKIVFDSGSTDISKDSYETLDNIALLLNKFKEAKLIVEGHTNSVGAKDKNMALSQQRADTIKIYLVGKGVESSHIDAVGYGESRPRVDKEHTNAKVLNRRVEFKVKY